MLIKVTIAGITPLILDRFHEGLLMKGPKSTSAGQELSPKEQCEQKLYKDDKDKLIIPSENLLKSIIEGGKFIKLKKKQLTTRDDTIVTGFFSIVEEFIPLQSTGGWRVDSRGIVNQSTKGRHICYRPIFDDWKLTFTVDFDTDEADLKTARELVDRAGRRIGLGVMRPARKGRYGQSKVILWQEQKLPILEAAE